MTLARLGGVAALLCASHPVADFWVQTDRQAVCKGGPGWPGQRACAAHVVTLTATHALALGLGAAAVGERLDPRRVAAGLAFNAATHYVIDRREPMRRLAGLLAFSGKDRFHDVGKPRDGHDDNPCLGTGSLVLDQALHHLCLGITACVIAGRP